MEGLELTAFQIISSVGTARSCYIEAIQAAKKSDYEEAEKLIKEATRLSLKGMTLMQACCRRRPLARATRSIC